MCEEQKPHIVSLLPGYIPFGDTPTPQLGPHDGPLPNHLWQATFTVSHVMTTAMLDRETVRDSCSSTDPSERQTDFANCSDYRIFIPTPFYVCNTLSIVELRVKPYLIF